MVYLVIITLVGALLRIYHLGFNSFWLDEAWTWYFSKMSWSEIWNTTAYEFNPPGFYWIEHTIMYSGESEIWLRLVPAVCGIITIPVMYLIGKQFYQSKKAGLIAALLMALSPFAVWYSQEARAYSTALLFIAICFYFWQKNKSVLCGVAGAVAFWMHFYAIIPIAAMAAWAVVNDKGKKPLMIKMAVFLFLTAPLIYTTTRLFFVRTSVPITYGMPGPELLINTVYALSGNNPVILPLLLSFLAGMWILYKTKWDRFILLSWMMGSMFGAGFACSYLFPMLPRYLIYILPFWILGITGLFNAFLRRE